MPVKPNILPVTALENAQNVLDQGFYLETGMHIGLEPIVLSVHGADTIAEVKLLISPFLR
jgi:hypothetical protein